MRRRSSWFPWAAALAFAACAASEPQKRELYRPGEPDAAQLDQLQQAETAFRRGEDAKWAEQSQRLAADPVTACWLCRMLVRDLIVRRERTRVGTRTLLEEAKTPLAAEERRTAMAIVAMGAAAVPCLCEDLLKSRQGMLLEFGAELVGAIGEPALPLLQPMLTDSEPRHRRSALRAAGAIAALPAGNPAFAAGLRDSDFTVRAEATAALGRRLPDAAPLLHGVLQRDEDAFVRRTAVKVLGNVPGKANAQQLLDYLRRCQRDLDWQGETAAQESLQRATGTRNARTADAWQRFIDGMQ